ncbi:hypothetical protein KTE26_02200 [Ralstonia mannitolilytica]|uniref:hypothetical protein n=1 Tax=Ralstonia mannitolilytica TaxID=105219 RepID=UPI00131517B1|nr:hypothetical protein [Ralstonia mannitolilytica]MBU9577245.1 hypothetical protein [Ralstonia mannitolilytica]
MAGSKRVEFRRTWAKEQVKLIAIYESAPTQRIVGFVEVESAIVGSASALWVICTNKGGGLTRAELRSYFAGKKQGAAILLGRVHAANTPVDPITVFKNFKAPQSFRYLSANETTALIKKIKSPGKTA